MSKTLLPSVAPIPSWKWGLVWLMFFATLINYMDRQTMQVTSSYLIRDFFGGKEEGYGRAESAFQYAFAFSQVLAGFLVDRYRVRWIYVGALLVWSAAGICTGFATTIQALILCRVVLGIAESFNWPCAVTIVRRTLPLEARSLANGLFHSGASLGAAVTPILAWFMIHPDGSNWRSIFIVVGAVGCVWALVWVWFMRGDRVHEIERNDAFPPEPHGPDPDIRFLKVFLLRTFWITLMVSISVNVCWHFFRAWLPRILQKDLHYDQSQMLWMLAGFFIAADLGSLAAGWITRKLTHRGFSVERSRKIVITGTSLLCLCAIPLAFGPPPLLEVPLVMIVAAGAMGGFANMFALAQQTAPNHSAKVVGLVSCVPWLLLAMINPTIGRLADQSGTFALSVICVAFVPLFGAAAGWLWPERPKAAAV